MVALVNTPTPSESTSRIGVVPPETPPPSETKRLVVVLIRPSKYDDDGYVMRYVRGVLPSNTLATLAGLTEEVVERGDIGRVDVEIVMMDEFVQKVDARALRRKYAKPGARVVVGLCGVQTNQFPRAADLARELHAQGLAVMIGGFHVSGAIALSKNGIPPECQALIDEGITLVKGEVEECWGDLLRDALHGKLATYYDIVERPDLSRAGIPVVEPRLMKKYAYPYLGTIDAGRGCPFTCSFCTIINVQGRKMRNRLAEKIKERIRSNAAMKIDYYFFTDDNFSRNPNWEQIFDALIELRQEEGIELQFMIQVDVLAYKLPRFMEKAQRAGCTQVFIGMETINPANLPAAGKRQNRVEDYKHMIESWHAHGIACHVGYIIGFPFDTVESVREDVRKLREEIKVDQASFFMLTPLPGSQDHTEMVARGEWMDPDYNRFDSFHPTTIHGRMSAEEWFGVYRESWEQFYTVPTMKEILSRANDRTYWGLFKNFVWYKYAALIEREHPMICGFFSLKDRKQRRPGYPVESVWRHYRRRVPEVLRIVGGMFRLYFEMQEVWLATRGRARIASNLEELRRRYDEVVERLGDRRTRAGEALVRSVAHMRAGAEEALSRAGQVSRQTAEDLIAQWDRLRQDSRGRVVRFLSHLNPLSLRIQSRAHLDRYWQQTWAKLREGRIFAINPLKLAYNFLRDAKLCLRFNLDFFLGYGR
ncbi:radical SAM protein [bacterium]|nr:radical SAM protein [bacterium]